jgi:conjugal transfer pilus assembly protein TraE
VINTKLEIVGNSASDEYIRVFGRYAAWLALNYSPATARSQFSELLTMFAPEKYAEVRKAFYVLADTVEMGHVSSVFHITRIKIDRVRSEMEVDGVRKAVRQRPAPGRKGQNVHDRISGDRRPVPDDQAL